ncbi:prevent-host-death family protein [Bifidobacterium hapali]|uniref:Antitoxin n=1 Tax=Bifidobacterium hapali TaxID=1630172 RepID=A0A261G463_9BIFI|nr:type II toxin-antitoxin system Phd/YefM family antitoxin [Bifidobacterium hapali]OZG66209.1 prevent-host-death family protein [Bifidobacterium hapali]
MDSVSLLDHLIPVSEFNHGGASKAFNSVSDGNPLIVLKNNKPSVVIISPNDYRKLTEAQEDFALYLEAKERIANANGEYLTHEDVFGEPAFNYSDADLADVEID